MAINIKIKTDVSGINDIKKSIDGVNDSVDELNDKDALGKFTEKTKTLKTQLKEMTIELQGLDPGTARFNELAIAAGKLKDEIADTNAVIKATAGSSVENLASGLSGVASIGIGAFQGIASAQALFGVESEDLQKTLVKLQAVAGLSDALNSLGGLNDTLTNVKASFNAVGQALGLVNKAEVVNAVVTTEAAAASTAQATATGAATVASNSLNKSLLANPVFLLIAGIGALAGAIAHFTSETTAAEAAQDAFNDTAEDYRKGAQDAILKTNEVGTAFELAKKGVISKEEALQTYNETLGDSFGKATNLNDAEKLYTEKTGAYIEAASLRAQANALFAKAAEKQAEAITAGLEDETTFLDNLAAGALQNLGGAIQGQEFLAKQQKKRTADIKKDSKEQGDAILKVGQDLLEQATNIEKNNNITKKLGDDDTKVKKKKIVDNRKDKDDDLKKEEEYNRKLLAYQDALENNRKDLITDAREKEEQVLADKYDKLFELAIEAGQDGKELIIAQQKELADIDKKYKDIASKKKEEDDAKLKKDEEDKAKEKKDRLIKDIDAELSLDKTTLPRKKELLIQKRDIELKEVNLTENEKLAIVEKYLKLTDDLVDDSNKKRKEVIKKSLSDLSGVFNQLGADTGNAFASAIGNSLDAASKAFEVFSDKEATRAEKTIASIQAVASVASGFISAKQEEDAEKLEEGNVAIDEANQKEIESLQRKLDAGLISQEQFDKQSANLEKKANAQKDAAAKAAFEQSKKYQIAQTTIAGIQGAVGAFAAGSSIGGPIVGAAFAAAVGAFTVANIAKINGTQYKSTNSSSATTSASPNVNSSSIDNKVAQPSFNLFGQGNNANTVGPGSSQEGNQNMTVQVNSQVSVSEINAVQNKVAVQAERSTL